MNQSVRPIIILSSLVAVLFVSVLYLLFLNFRKPSIVNIPISTPTLIIHPTDTVNVDSMSDWTTYTNSKLGFKLKYPQDWRVKEKTSEINLCPGDYQLNKECFSITPEVLSLTKYIADYEKRTGNLINSINDSEIKYQGGYTIYNIFRSGKTENYGFIYITNQKLNFVVTDNGWDDYGYHQEPKILSTFKFL